MNKFKKVLKFLLGESFVQMYHDVKAHKQNLYLCDPITAAIMTAILGTTAVVGGAGAGIAALSGAFDAPEENGGGAAPASNYVAPSNETGAITDVGDVETQAAQRRLARLSKYFTSPTGVLDTPTGTTGVF